MFYDFITNYADNKLKSKHLNNQFPRIIMNLFADQTRSTFLDRLDRTLMNYATTDRKTTSSILGFQVFLIKNHHLL